MNSSLKIIRLFILVSVFISSNTFGQQKSDTLKYRNIVKYNITAPLMWGVKNFIFEYEHIFSDYNSFSVGLGYRTFPQMIGDPELNNQGVFIRDFKSSGGFSSTVDYRFYLKSENKYMTPHGLYIAPFLHYFNNKSENTISTLSGLAEADISTRLDVFSAGAKLGYQFVFKNRITLDLSLLGPSASWYNIDLKVDGNVDVKDIDEEMLDYILESYPIFNLFFNEIETSKSGRVSKIGYGFRYYFQIGYLF